MTIVRVGLEAHDARAKGGNALAYIGPDDNNADIAYAAVKQVSDLFVLAGVFTDSRPYKEVVPGTS